MGCWSAVSAPLCSQVRQRAFLQETADPWASILSMWGQGEVHSQTSVQAQRALGEISVMNLWPLLETFASSELHWSINCWDIIQLSALAALSSSYSCICIWLCLVSFNHLFMPPSVWSPRCCPSLVEAVFWCAESLWGFSSYSPAQSAALASTCSRCSVWLRRLEQASHQEPRTWWTWCTSSKRWN